MAINPKTLGEIEKKVEEYIALYLNGFYLFCSFNFCKSCSLER